MSDLVIYEGADVTGVVMPFTGERVELASASVDDLAVVRSELRQWIEAAQAAVAYVDGEVEARARAAGSWTLHGDAHTLVVRLQNGYIRSDAAAQLRAELERFADAGLVTPEAVDNCVPLVLVAKPKPGALRKLAEITTSAEVRDAILSLLPDEQRRVEEA